MQLKSVALAFSLAAFAMASAYANDTSKQSSTSSKSPSMSQSSSSTPSSSGASSSSSSQKSAASGGSSSSSSSKSFDQLDKDHDGKLSREEYNAAQGSSAWAVCMTLPIQSGEV